MKDVNPLVSSIQKLKDNGIEVIYGILEEEAKELNEVFITNMTEKRPFVALKTAALTNCKEVCLFICQFAFFLFDMHVILLQTVTCGLS